MIVFGIGQGTGNVIQCEPAIACLRAKGLKVYVSKNCTWPNGYRVLDGRVDGYVDNGDPNVKHFIQSCWYRPFNFPNAKNYHVPYEPINQVDLHWKAANEFYHREFGDKLDVPKPPVLATDLPYELKKKEFIAVHPARTKSNISWRLKLYKNYRKLVYDISRTNKVVTVGVEGIDEYWKLPYNNFLPPSSLPLEHAQFLLANCKALITSASGWAFMGAAIGIPTYVLWGPDSLTRNKPLGANVHILKHDDCQQCYGIKTLRTEIPECPYNNKCMNHTSEEVINALLSV